MQQKFEEQLKQLEPRLNRLKISEKNNYHFNS